ncbi:MAG: hypothetical protein AAB427_00200, partial [Chloroflexota bacterium]
DAHHPSDFGLAEYGVATARRGWVAASHVINVWDSDRLRGWLQDRAKGASLSTVPARSTKKAATQKKPAAKKRVSKSKR